MIKKAMVVAIEGVVLVAVAAFIVNWLISPG